MSAAIRDLAQAFLLLGGGYAHWANVIPPAFYGRETGDAIAAAMAQLAAGTGFDAAHPLESLSYGDLPFLAQTLACEDRWTGCVDGVHEIALVSRADAATETIYLRAADGPTLIREDFLESYSPPDDMEIPEGWNGLALVIEEQPCPEPCRRGAIFVVFQPIDAVDLVLADYDVLLCGVWGRSDQEPIGACPACGAPGWMTGSALTRAHARRVDLVERAADASGQLHGLWLKTRDAPNWRLIFRSWLARALAAHRERDSSA